MESTIIFNAVYRNPNHGQVSIKTDFAEFEFYQDLKTLEIP